MASQKPAKNGSTAVNDLTREREKIQRDLAKPELPAKGKTGKTKMVTVTFNVTVPENTAGTKRSVFLAGTFNQLNKKIADWDTQGQPMKKVDKQHWTISLTGPEHAVIEYKYTLGDWDHVERNEHCHDISNRRVTLTMTSDELQTINDTVHNWRNVKPCGD